MNIVFWYTVKFQSYTVYLNSDVQCVSKYPNIVILEMYCDNDTGLQVYQYFCLVQFVQFNSEGILLTNFIKRFI